MVGREDFTGQTTSAIPLFWGRAGPKLIDNESCISGVFKAVRCFLDKPAACAAKRVSTSWPILATEVGGGGHSQKSPA